MSPEGQVSIWIGLRARGKHKVHLSCDRPVLVSQMLEGRPIDEALRLLPLIFNVCAQAQVAAGVRACASALGETLPLASERARERLLAIESLREQLWRIALDWPALADRPPDRHALATMLAVQREWQAAVETGDWRRLGEPSESVQDHLIEQIRQLLEQRIFGMTVSDWLALRDQDDFDDWLSHGKTVASAALAAIQRRGWGGVGRAEVKSLPPCLDPFRLQSNLDDLDFVRYPHWDGICRETSVFTRVDSPLLRSLRGGYGNGLLPRMVARLVEMAHCFQRLTSRSAVAPEPLPGGLGEARAARGRLLHAVQLDAQQRIRRYRILAPTEWNFHPRGVVAQALAGLEGGAETVVAQAHQVIQAIDPCVSYTLSAEPLRNTAYA